jgi:hypothetical protein
MQDQEQHGGSEHDHFDDDDLKAADDALEKARAMPKGPERILALKEAGQMRYDAEQRRRPKRKTENDKRKPRE